MFWQQQSDVLFPLFLPHISLNCFSV